MKTKIQETLKLTSKTCGIMLMILLFASYALTAQTFELVKDINPSGDSNFNGLMVFDGNLYFSADDGTHGYEVWTSDGTTSGTKLLKDIYSDPMSGNGTNDYYFNSLEFDGRLFFTANDGITPNDELWVTDGTTLGTTFFKNITISESAKIIEYNGKFYFSGFFGVNGYELGVSDGTSAGTKMLKDINSGYPHSGPTHFKKFNGKLYFRANDGIHGDEPWVTDGTESGTQLLKDINTGVDNSVPRGFTEYNGKLYFRADDGIHGFELWATDGTESGSQLLKDINPSSPDSSPTDLIEYNGKLYFNAEDGNLNHGKELWVTDGTESGTQLLKDINPGEGSGDPINFIKYNGKLCFLANDGVHGYDLWVTDGTTAGTKMLIDIEPGAPPLFSEFNGKLYFKASSGGANGIQLWATDGTPEGTTSIIPNFGTNLNALSYTHDLLVFEGSLYFLANYDTNGNELWKFMPDLLEVQDHEKPNIRAYPNPVQNVLHLETTEQNIQNINLFSITGQTLKSWGAQSEINLSQFAPGVYFVKITTKNGLSSIKRVVKN